MKKKLVFRFIRHSLRALRSKEADVLCTWLLIAAVIYVAGQLTTAVLAGRIPYAQ